MYSKTVWALAMVAAAASGIAQSPELPSRFDVASIKPSVITNGSFALRLLPGGGLSCVAVTLKMLIMEAYGVKAFQVSGGPSWVGAAQWDLEARIGGVQARLPREREDAMIRALLEDRFQLRVRRKTKEMSVFALIVMKGGSKLTPHTGAAVPSTERIRMGIGSFNIKQGGVGLLVNELQRQLSRVVIDKTDLKDAYDYALTWAPEPGQGGAESLGLPPQPDTVLPRPDGPSIFTALQEQLGLKLESAKGPVEVFVIDHVEKPSEN
jgi:bla regulator protein blaR1